MPRRRRAASLTAVATASGEKFESGTEQRYELVDDHWRVAGHEKTLNEPAH